MVQCRMARAALNWTLDDLAAASDVSRRLGARFEAGEAVVPPRVQRLRAAFEASGVFFIDRANREGMISPKAEGLKVLASSRAWSLCDITRNRIVLGGCMSPLCISRHCVMDFARRDRGLDTR